ncbi:MAG: ankyrin repeat domain-containing protein [Nitriliruptorales bacterium]
MSAELSSRPDLRQLRRQAKDLLRAAKSGDPDASARIRAVSDRQILASAQLAVAREYGFASWRRLKLEVERREILNDRDTARLRRLLTEDPGLVSEKMERWCDHPLGVAPLNYVAMLRFDAGRLGLPPGPAGTADVARELIAAGAAVDGHPDDTETPLITAASYGDVEVARTLLEAGAAIDAVAAPDAGGAPGGTALLHAAVFGMTDVVDLLAAAGARVRSIEEAAAVGDVRGWLTADTPIQARIRSLVMAADHERLDVIDELVAAGTPVDAIDEHFGRQALRVASRNGRPASVRRLLAHGADPNLRDEQDRTPLDLTRPDHLDLSHPGHDQAAAILEPLTD